jgi:hypothetical protein
VPSCAGADRSPVRPAAVVELELVYGVGRLDRFETTGTTQSFQTRLQAQF